MKVARAEMVGLFAGLLDDNGLLEVPLGRMIGTYSTAMKRKLVLLGALRLHG
jgi:hypothetical protein